MMGHCFFTVDVDLDPSTFLATAISDPRIPSELKPYYEAFSSLYQKKYGFRQYELHAMALSAVVVLWFQLTSTIEAFLAREQSGPFQIELYNSFVKDFASKINQLKLASIGISVARQFTEGNEGLSFLQNLTEKLDTPLSQEAFVLGTMECAHFKLLLGDNEGTKEAMDQCQKVLDGLDSVDLTVHASYYRVSGDYYKAIAKYAEYYKAALLYLACVNVDTDLSPPIKVQLAHDLGLSALLGKIYNFGELLMHPILDSLNGTEYEWIKELLFAFNSGDISKFESLLPQLGREPLLLESQSFLREKICLMALIESVFKRPTSDRILPFEVIAAEARVSVDEVEHLVMRALSLKLIRGTLDQVSSTATISWVQPRVLDRTAIEGLRDRLQAWTDRVSGVGKFTQAQGQELFVH